MNEGSSSGRAHPDMAPRLTAIIVGAGMSGLLAGIRLKKEGIHSFAILEKSTDVGGVWHQNTYPGASCDTPSPVYAYSFRSKADWSRMFAAQPEILEYFRDAADDTGLRPHIAFDVEALGAEFDEREGLWHVSASGERSWTAKFLILATGQLNRPLVPDVPGKRDFAGVQFHSARWNHNANIAGKRVVAVGTGASAVQYIPHLAQSAGQLTVVQRSANWIVPRKDFAISKGWQTAFRWSPMLQTILRAYAFSHRELAYRAIGNPGGWIARRLENAARGHLEEQVPDPVLRRKLTPGHPPGCKPLLVTSDFYPALMRKNVELVTAPVTRVHQTGVELANGTRIPAEILIWGTGFHTAGLMAPIAVTGLAGQDLRTKWAKGAFAYKGTLVSGFPNMAVLYGPNTHVEHNSMIFMAERQMDLTIQMIRTVLGRDLRYADIRADAEGAWNAALKRRLDRSVWAADCESWYKHEGRIPTNWPGTASAFAWNMRSIDERQFDLCSRRVPGMTEHLV